MRVRDTSKLMAEQPVPRFFLILMLLSTILIALVIRPVAKELLLAAVFAGMLWSPQEWLSAKLRGRRSLAAGLLTTAVVVVLLGPIATTLTYVVSEGADGVAFVSEALRSDEVRGVVGHLPETARDAVNGAIDRLPRDLDELGGLLGDYKEETATTVRKALVSTGSFVFRAVLMLIALFFFLVSGASLVDWLDSISPLRAGRTLELLSTFRRVSYAVIMSAAITAAVQAAAALVGYAIAGVPSPLFFGLVTFFVAFIPAIGAAVVCLFAAALLLLTGHPYAAVFLAVWGVVVVGLVDNLIKRGLEIHGAVVFFALIGGLATFGAIGLLLGPLLVSLFLAVLRLYHEDYTPQDARVPSVPGLPASEPAPTPTPVS